MKQEPSCPREAADRQSAEDVTPYGGKKTQTSGWTVPTTRTPSLGAPGRRPRGVSIGYAIRAYLEAHPQERDRLAQKYGWVD
jgi:hypothetical protein